MIRGLLLLNELLKMFYKQFEKYKKRGRERASHQPIMFFSAKKDQMTDITWKLEASLC